MDIVVTGANGFLGKHLVLALQRLGHTVLPITRQTSPAQRSRALRRADFVYHLAGVNRPNNPDAFTSENVGFTEAIAMELLSYNPVPVVFASSTQAQMNNPYGVSKREAEETLLIYAERAETNVYLYRLPNVFGKWARPFYNSAVATFCHQVAHGQTLEILNPERLMTLAHIDDVVASFVSVLNESAELYPVVISHDMTLFDVARTIESFETVRKARGIPDLSNRFIKQLYSTYVSYLPMERMATSLKMHQDARGSFTELFKTPDRGQVSVNIARPGVTKGEHWHDTKHEQFIVVSGEGIIRLRAIDHEKVMVFHVSGEQLEVIDIPPGYVHNIENTGTVDLITVMWVNEPFDILSPDTYAQKVEEYESEVS